MAGEMRRQIGAAAQGPPEPGAPPSEAFLKGAECRRRRYRLGGDFVGFQGHFEGRPVLPALAQVLMAQDMIEALLNRAVTLRAVTQAKFLSPVGPDRIVSVYAARPGDGADWRLHLTTAESDGSETDTAFLRLSVEDRHGL